MILYRLVVLILAVVGFAFLSALVVEAQPKNEVSKQVRAKLFKQVLADFSDVRDCVAQEDGGAAAIEENMFIQEVDLNRDGVKEYDVEPSGSCICGNVNCSIYLYRQSGDGYELILDSASGLGLEVLKTSSNGYLDVQVNARDTLATQSRTTYKYDGKEYREARAIIVHQGTGESKPAYRRVQFQRGASSTTVQGKASLVMPDLWLVGARAGQTMTVQLTSLRKVVSFTVMTSRTTEILADDKRTWTGSLPENGDYHIIVNADERGGTYSLTISIK